MQKYCFYSKRDVKREPQSVIQAENLQQAGQFFALQKGLSLDDFNLIFTVAPYIHENTTTKSSKQLLFG